jgi:prefoldin subunit 5
MVPISKVGFFPNGNIKHSNEFLVAIGDNYFLERTSQECQPIIQRRIEKL